MDYIYIDEKGPQETIRITNPYNDETKIKLANDNMFVYVANLIKVNGENLQEIDEKYMLLEREYMSSRKFRTDKELKGKDLLGKNFKFGIASLKGRELDFYSSLFDLLLENRVDNLLFTINKVSLLADVRLNNWILELEEKRFIESAVLFKYSLVKYLELEASESVIHSAFEPNKSNKEVLTEIQKDMVDFIEKNKHIQRMKFQIQEYKQLIKTIRQTKHLIQGTSFNKVLFDWNKVSFDIDLWTTELILANKFNNKSTELILDEGIPIEPFNKLGFKTIKENEDSNNHVGLRIADVLVVLSGKYISRLACDLRYDKNKPEKRKLLPIDWFQLDEEQFYLLKKMQKYFFPDNSKYCFIVDTYFDDAVVFETYFSYISNFESFNNYKDQMEEHVENYNKYVLKNLSTKYNTAIMDEKMTRIVSGSRIAGIEAGLVRPL